MAAFKKLPTLTILDEIPAYDSISSSGLDPLAKPSYLNANTAVAYALAQLCA